jgi:FkbM family methyltransferase
MGVPSPQRLVRKVIRQVRSFRDHRTWLKTINCINAVQEQISSKSCRPVFLDGKDAYFKDRYGNFFFSNFRDRVLELERKDVWEQRESEFILANLKESDVFIDVGANIGYFSLLASTITPHVYSIEPVPGTFKILEKNVSFNNRHNSIKTINIGLGDKAESLKILNEFGPKNRLVANGDSNKYSTVDVPVKTLDQVVEELGIKTVDFIKVDIEGFEYFFVRGALNTLKTHKPLVLIEIEERRTMKFNKRADDVFQLFFDLGYSCRGFGDSGLTDIIKSSANLDLSTRDFLFFDDQRRVPL